MQDVGARLDGENLVVELDVAASRLAGAVEGLYLDLHRLAFLAFVGVGGRLVALGRVGASLSAWAASAASASAACGFRLGGSAGFLLGGDRRDFLVARQRRNLVDRGVVDQAGRGHFAIRRSCALRVDQAGRIRQLCRCAAA